MRIETPARLHLGFLDLGGTLGRRFGGIGLSVRPLTTIVRAMPHAGLEVVGECSERARRFVETLLERLRLPPEIRVCIDTAIPPHTGLGSGTQLALATATAVARVFGCKPPAAELAQILGRGKRSGIGLGLFERGGLVVDGGHGAATSIPPVVSRLDFPEEWRAVLILDPGSAGLSGRAEIEAFRALKPMDAATAGHLCHVTLMGLLPAVAERDFDAFSAAVGDIQGVVGDYFAAVQNGRYTSAPVREALKLCVREFGLKGVGQSSWGPTGFAFAESDDKATALIDALNGAFNEAGTLTFRKCEPCNRGAIVSGTVEQRPRPRSISAY
ncbi:MAG: beta-ribofuranosylaminobenzene 5'-phosphate synthase family protein [Pseudomonadota bacterium]|nr:beta-ribofuranosylaminobenzene 5'-phosphate synthase family protein [Pseudomonadota bacterium]